MVIMIHISCSARLPLIPPAVLLLGRSPRKGLCKVSAILKRQFQDNPVFLYQSTPLWAFHCCVIIYLYQNDGRATTDAARQNLNLITAF